MKRLETATVQIGEDKYPFRFSVLSFMMYSEQFGKEITQCKTLSDQLNYFYCAYQAGCEYSNTEKTIADINAWIRLLDEYPEVLKELGSLLTESTSKKK